MPLNFTPVIPSSEFVHYNISYMYAPNPSSLMATPEVFFFCLAAGVALLLISAFLPLGVCSDLAAVISSGFLFLSTIYAWAVDTVTSYGVAVFESAATIPPTAAIHEYVSMENHVIYHYDYLGILSGILLVISFANWYRLWLDYKRITEQEPQRVEAMPQNVQGMKDIRAEDERENGYRDMSDPYRGTRPR